MLGLFPFSAVGAPTQRVRVNSNAAPMPTRETPDRKERVFISFLRPARRMKKAVIMMMSSGPIAAQFISSKFIANSMDLPKKFLPWF